MLLRGKVFGVVETMLSSVNIVYLEKNAYLGLVTAWRKRGGAHQEVVRPLSNAARCPIG